MSPWHGKRTIAIVTACTSADGTADFAFTEVEVTHDEYENGVHYDLVEDGLTDTRYEAPFCHFDQFDAPEFLLPAVKQYLGIT